MTNRENHERGYAPKGRPPILRMETKQERVNMISAISQEGCVRFMTYGDNMTQQRMISFIRHLVLDSERKVYLILDNLKVHHGKILSAWLDKHSTQIEMFFLPAYSPEINPDEYLNHGLKLAVHSGVLPSSARDISHKIHSFMRRLQKYPAKISAFFLHPAVSYVSPQK